jgi:hypothetical protein
MNEKRTERVYITPWNTIFDPYTYSDNRKPTTLINEVIPHADISKRLVKFAALKE